MVSGYQNGTIAQLLQAIIGQINFDGEPISNIGDILLSILEQTPYDDEPKSVLAELFLKLKAKLENEPFEPYDKEPQSAIAEILLSILNVTPYEKEPNSRIAELLLELKAELESYVILTASGAIANFTTSLALPLVSLKASIVATESGSGTKSPTNPYTLGGFSNAVISHSGEDMSNPDQTTLALGQTVYGGEIVLTKKASGYGVKLRKTWDYADLSNFTFTLASQDRWECLDIRADVLRPSANNVKANILCTDFETLTANGLYSDTSLLGIAVANNGIMYIRNGSTENTPTGKIIYELATPIEIDLTDASDIVALVGTNNVWSDTGDMEVEYYANISDNLEQTSKSRAIMKAEKELKEKQEKELKELDEKETTNEPTKEIGETKK